MRTMKTQIDIIKKFNEIYIVFNTLDKHDGGGVGFTWFKTSEDATTWAIKRNNMGLQFISSAAILVTKTKIDELCRKWWICFDMCDEYGGGVGWLFKNKRVAQDFIRYEKRVNYLYDQGVSIPSVWFIKM